MTTVNHRGPVVERGALGWMIVEYQPGYVTPTPRSGFYPTRRRARAALRNRRRVAATRVHQPAGEE